MFIQSNRFTKFYRTHKTQWVAFLTIGQLIAIAIALLTLLSILGWSLAISQAIAWLNRLVTDSLPPQKLLMPSLDAVAATDTTMPTANEILAAWQEKAAQVLITPLQPTVAARFLQTMSIRQLKKMASDRHISKYSNLSKAELVAALN